MCVSRGLPLCLCGIEVCFNVYVMCVYVCRGICYCVCVCVCLEGSASVWVCVWRGVLLYRSVCGGDLTPVVCLQVQASGKVCALVKSHFMTRPYVFLFSFGVKQWLYRISRSFSNLPAESLFLFGESINPPKLNSRSTGALDGVGELYFMYIFLRFGN